MELKRQVAASRKEGEKYCPKKPPKIPVPPVQPFQRYETKNGPQIYFSESLQAHLVGDEPVYPLSPKDGEKIFQKVFHLCDTGHNSAERERWLDFKAKEGNIWRFSATDFAAYLGAGYDPASKRYRNFAARLQNKGALPTKRLTSFQQKIFKEGLDAEATMKRIMQEKFSFKFIPKASGACTRRRTLGATLLATLDAAVQTKFGDVLLVEFKLYLKKYPLLEILQHNPFDGEEGVLPPNVYRSFKGFWIQIMVQLMVTGLNKALLVVYDRKHMVIFLIEKDHRSEEWMKEMLVKLLFSLLKFGCVYRPRNILEVVHTPNFCSGS